MTSEWAPATIATVAVLGLGYSALRWIFAPHLRQTIQTTIDDTVGPRLEEMPKLTTAVSELTSAIREQNRDSEDLKNGMNELKIEVHGLRGDFGELRERTARLEGEREAKPRRRKAAR